VPWIHSTDPGKAAAGGLQLAPPDTLRLASTKPHLWHLRCAGTSMPCPGSGPARTKKGRGLSQPWGLGASPLTGNRCKAGANSLRKCMAEVWPMFLPINATPVFLACASIPRLCHTGKQGWEVREP